MNRPHIICHMMTAVDGRIDCGMTAKLEGVKEYYETLHALNTPTSLSGRVTAQLEMAEEGTFTPEQQDIFGQEGFQKGGRCGLQRCDRHKRNPALAGARWQ